MGKGLRAVVVCCAVVLGVAGQAQAARKDRTRHRHALMTEAQAVKHAKAYASTVGAQTYTLHCDRSSATGFYCPVHYDGIAGPLDGFFGDADDVLAVSNRTGRVVVHSALWAAG